MSTARAIHRIARTLAAVVGVLSIFMLWGNATASGQTLTAAPAAAHTSTMAAVGHADAAAQAVNSGKTQGADPAAAASSYCRPGPRPVYTCGPYSNYYGCTAVASVFRMWGYWVSDCWYFPHGNAYGGRPGYYF